MTLVAAALPLAAALWLALLAGSGAEGKRASASVQAPERDQPNVLYILTDDQTLSSFHPRVMPRTFRHLVRPGTNFRQAIASPPLCCPARAGLATGQYAHNHGVEGQDYADLVDNHNTLAVWLERAGYENAFIGKYMNGYEPHLGHEPDRGYQRWFAFHGGSAYHRYRISDQGRLRSFGRGRADYSTAVLNRATQRFICAEAAHDRPWFATLSHWGPHSDRASHRHCEAPAAKPQHPSDLRRFRDQRAPRTPAFNAHDVTGKPPAIASRPRLDRTMIGRVDRNWRCQLAALQSVDRGVGQLMGELRRSGQLDETVVIFVSDNGTMFGEHRVHQGKRYFYEPVARVPMVIRLPQRLRRGRDQVRATTAPVSTVDLAATILRLAGAEPCADRGDCRRLDGRSLIALMRFPGHGDFAGRAIPVTLDYAPTCNHVHAIRTPGMSYAVDTAPETCARADELYDLRADPHQLRNLIDSPAHQEMRQAADRRLERLTSCSGVEGRDPKLSDRPHCE